MHTIVSSRNAPHLVPRFREWIESTWGEVDPFESVVGDIVVPAPVLAVEQQELLGGAGFTSFAKPESTVAGIWINALYVAPEFRKRGIGLDLIKGAEAEARNLEIEELFVFTDIPEIYFRLGWDIVQVVNDVSVLNRSLTN